MIRTLCTLGAALLWLTACGGSDETEPGGYSDVCSVKGDCGEPYDCIAGVCTNYCTGDADCKKNADTSVCESMHCFEPCTDAIDCRGGLQCKLVASNRATCRAQ